MRVLVCGGRDYADHDWLFKELDALRVSRGVTVVISGCAPGADTIGIEWAVARKVEIVRFPADWQKHGRAAGPIRNQRMLNEGRPDLVVAFPGGRGTADMVKRAIAAGVETIRL
jgi:predicted Rossmann-fold nucleotide-binding protein